MQNAQALEKVAEWLEEGAQHVKVAGHEIAYFDMDVGVTPPSLLDASADCGTACCIAGAIVQFENLIPPVMLYKQAPNFFDSEDEDGNIEAKGVGTLAREHLGISEYKANQLFTPWDYFDFDDTSDFTRAKRAAAVIRHFIATNEVEWDLFDDEGQNVDLLTEEE